MSLAKEAQINFDGFNVPVEDADIMQSDDCEIEGTVMLQMEEDEEPQTFDFTLPMMPELEGGKLDAINVEEIDDEIEIEEPDPWAWTIDNFLDWLQDKIKNVPRHNNETAGLERAIAYLENIDKEISKAVRSDLNNKIAIDTVESAREEIHQGLEKLYDRLETVMENKGYKKKKKTASLNKEGSKSTHISGISIVVPLFVSSVVRTCINSMVSAGKDIEDCFHELINKFDMTDREIFEAIQLFADMGYAIRRPRGYKLDEEIDYTSTDVFDQLANYPG